MNERQFFRTHNPADPLIKPILISGGVLILLLLLAWAASLTRSEEPSEAVIILGLMGTLVMCVMAALLNKGGLVTGLNLDRPGSLYGFFYLLYYALPLSLLALGWAGDVRYLTTMTGLVILGFLAFWAGTQLTGVKQHLAPPLQSLTEEESRALLVICYIGASLVYSFYVWRLSIGQFYSHASYYEQQTTLAASLLQNFAGQFSYPLFILGSILTGIAHPVVAKRARRFLLIYILSIVVIATAASEFREALTSLLFLIVARNAQNRPVRIRHVFVSCLAGIFALTVVQGTREVVRDSGIADSSNQMVYSLDHALDGINSVLHGERPVVMQATIDRATAPLIFFSDVIDALNRGQGHLHEAVLLDSLYSLVPRAVWRSKPVMVSTQLQIEEKLHLPLFDASPGPIIQFYADWGVSGVVLGFFCFGMFLGLLTKYAKRSESVVHLLALAWVWSVAVQVETDLSLGILVALRHLLVVIVLYRVALFWIRLSGRQSHVPAHAFSTSGSKQRAVPSSSNPCAS
ncbi:MAG TPA: hypothetical protein VJ761_19600 [Ktedonobacteraceae bacterium]|nr:hypothetical protein [Ktedonobacteraceae bacterium]